MSQQVLINGVPVTDKRDDIVEMPVIVDKKGNVLLFDPNMSKLSDSQLTYIADIHKGRIQYRKFEIVYQDILKPDRKGQQFCTRKGCTALAEKGSDECCLH